MRFSRYATVFTVYCVTTLRVQDPCFQSVSSHKLNPFSYPGCPRPFPDDDFLVENVWIKFYQTFSLFNHIFYTNLSVQTFTSHKLEIFGHWQKTAWDMGTIMKRTLTIKESQHMRSRSCLSSKRLVIAK